MHTQQVAFILAILVLKLEVAATNETKQEKETGTNTHNGISFIAMWEEKKRKKPSDSYFDIEHTFKIIVMGNLWFTCWLPIPLLPASIPVCGEILSLGRTLLHILQCLPPVLSLYSCDCLCVCFHSSSQRFFLPLLHSQFSSFVLSLSFHSTPFTFYVYSEQEITIVSRLPTQTMAKEADHLFFVTILFQSRVALDSIWNRIDFDLNQVNVRERRHKEETHLRWQTKHLPRKIRINNSKWEWYKPQAAA